MISTFETNIRMLGGLLGGHSAALDLADQGRIKYDNCLLRFAKQVGDKLMPAFNTSTGIPFSRVNLRTGFVKKSQPETCTACAGTLILEFAALSRYLNEPSYEEAARKALDTIWKRRHQGTGLVGTVINTANGDWVRRESGVGAGIDSYYEYLLKAYILLGDEEYLERFNVHYSSIKRYIKSGPMLVDVQMHKPTEQSRGFMDALSAFWPGVQVLKGDVQHAIETHELLYQVFQKYGQIPEAFTHRFDIHWGQYPLRPEFAESTFLLYKATEDPYYLKVGRDIVNALEAQTRVPCGFAGIKDVRNKSHEDRMDSFFLAEMFKYLFLIFAEKEDFTIDPDRYVFTTEAHLLPLTLRLSSFSNHTDCIKPNHSSVNMDGNPAKSCINPLPNGQTGKLYQVEELQAWREYARNFMVERQPHWPGDAKKNGPKGQGKAETRYYRDGPKLRAKDFMLGNKEHEKYLTKMGIQIVNRNGNVQLMHVPETAINGQYSEEGLVFMTEMIKLNEEEDAQNVNQVEHRHVTLLTDPPKSVLAGPAQFGSDLSDGPVVGLMARAEPLMGCSPLTNCHEINGRIAILRRGGCMFAEKVKHAEDCLAKGAIIIDNQPGTSGDGLGIFSMAGDGETAVEIGSVFLPSKEADVILDAYKLDKMTQVALSATKVDVHKLKKEHINENTVLSDTIRKQKELRRSKGTLPANEKLESSTSENQTDETEHEPEHDEL